MTSEAVVLDASAIVRAVTGGDANAASWLRAAVAGQLRPAAPDLLFPEVANALLVYVRAGALGAREARARLRFVLDLPLETVPARALAEPALALALASGLSAYDGCYAALAEAQGATLVTADARLAAAVGRGALLPDAAPPG